MKHILFVICLLLLIACSCSPERVAESRFVEPDKLYRTLEANVRSHQEFEVIIDIDHARLGKKAKSPMPPAHVLIWSDSELEAAILKHNPLAAIDLPLRALAYEDPKTGIAAVIANRFNYLANRYALPNDATIRERYDTDIAKAMANIPSESIVKFSSDSMPDAGLITLNSPYDFATTKTRILDVINSQSDAIVFGELDFAARSQKHGVTLEQVYLILFGAPGPGGKVMASAPTLGLDAFCQKLLIWQDSHGGVNVSFNDLRALAERQQVSSGLALRVVNRRLKETFTKALEQ
ncbi:MAG: DUF302 domain-containing protein [Nitrospirota bacterium]|nr:DUF302 domain-containing protein [Nitrospirota bacterium]